MRKHLLLILILNFVLAINCLGQIVRYTTTNLNVRKGPSTNYGILGTVPANTEVTIYDYDYNDYQWLQVEYNGKTGYINTKYLSSQKTVTARVNTSSYDWNYTSTKSKTTYSRTSSSSSYGGGNGYYINCDGQRIQRPTHYETRPAGATAVCRDGTYSFSTHTRGTCSHHGGVKAWL